MERRSIKDHINVFSSYTRLKDFSSRFVKSGFGARYQLMTTRLGLSGYVWCSRGLEGRPSRTQAIEKNYPVSAFDRLRLAFHWQTQTSIFDEVQTTEIIAVAPGESGWSAGPGTS